MLGVIMVMCQVVFHITREALANIIRGIKYISTRQKSLFPDDMIVYDWKI